MRPKQMNGYQTRIVEQHKIPGGLVTAYRRKGYLIDRCVHWLPGSGRGFFLHRYWDEVGLLEGREFRQHDRYGVYHAADGRTVNLCCDPDRLESTCWNSRRRTHRSSKCSERVPLWQMVLLMVVLVMWGGLVFSLLPKLDSFFVRTWFAWFPSWSLPGNTLGDPSQHSQSALALTAFALLVLNGIVGPIVEELYFRGYLLPHIPAARWWEPLINVLLFSLYHFFSPWQNITRILALLPLVYAVACKRNIYIGIWTHCTLNTVATVSALAILLR